MILVKLQLLAYWHPGTGKGDGPNADAIVNRDGAGLPWLPGKTVKGLLRDGAQTAAEAQLLRTEQITAVFGTQLDLKDDAEPARHASKTGAARFGSARLGATLAEARAYAAWAKADGNGAKEHLFQRIASTKLDEQGRAENQTLRTIEVVVPCALVAEIEGDASTLASTLAVLQAAAPFVNAIGAHRSRGLGRCIVTVEQT